jgi:hypothetical protein
VRLIDTDEVDCRQLVVFDHGVGSMKHGVCPAVTNPAD